MNRYNYILFDLDGTLTDSAEGIINSVLYALEKKGIKETNRQKLTAFVGPPLIDSFMKYYGMTKDEAEEMVVKYREYFREYGWKENAVYEGVVEMLEKLQATGKHLFVATSKPEVFAKKILEYFDLAKYFEYIGGSTFDGSISSKDQVIAYVLDCIGREHMEEMVMVGDREHDVLGAKKNHLPCVGVLYGYGDRTELEEAGADIICESALQLPECL